jgi:hypothetical protein
VADVVFVLFVEFVVINLVETPAPEEQTLFQVQPDTFEEQRVLEMQAGKCCDRLSMLFAEICAPSGAVEPDI